MNNVLKSVLTVLTLSLFFIFGVPSPKASAQYDDTYVSYNDFYQNLAPYGQWIEDSRYGYVWSPNEESSFRPYYTNGHWVMTDYGNTWISDYPWGWACFHYGRWTFDSYYGWLWIPGTNWGPAWVAWREGDGFFGWAPLGPDYSFENSGVDYYCPNDWWVFIPPQYVYTGNYYHYWYGPRGNSNIIKSTRYVNNTYENNHITYVSGPHVRQVEQAGHVTVQVYKLHNSTNLTTKVHNDQIRMYRPAEIRPSGTINGQRITPPNVVSAPQPISKPQSTNGRQYTAPEYKNDIPRTGHQDAVGTHVNEAVKAKPAPRNTTNPFEYDVNRPVNQPRPGEFVPQQQPQPQITRPQPAPQPQITRPQPPVQRNEPSRPAPRQAPAPQPQQQPAPVQRTAPAPQQLTRPQPPAPQQQGRQPQRESGRR